MRKTVLLGTCAALLAPACSTKEIGERPVFISDRVPSADHGGLQIVFADQPNTYTNEFAGEVFMDGVQLASGQNEYVSVQPRLAFPGGAESMGYLPAGRHHFEIKEVRLGARGPTLFSVDGEITAGVITELYLFGPEDAVDGRFLVLPASVASGMAHVSLMNLVGTGQSVEVVSCTGGSPCIPLSAPLALGEAFAGDFPSDTLLINTAAEKPLFSNGAALGYRQVPTDAVPDPPVQPLSYNSWYWEDLSPPTNLVLAAPCWMLPTGEVQRAF